MTPTDLELRQRHMACSSCGALLALGANGLESAQQRARAEHPGDRLVIERSPDGLTLHVPRVRSIVTIQPPDVKLGLVIGVGTFVLAKILWPGGPGFLILIVATIAAIFLLARRRTQLPPLVLRGNQLTPSAFAAPVRTDEIRQIYATRTAVSVPGGKPMEPQCNVYALLHDGRRVHLVGPVSTIDVALRVEAILDVELRLFEREVHGQHDRPEDAPGARSAAVIPEREETGETVEVQCDSCGAPLTVDNAARLRGFAACMHCRSVTLVVLPSGAPVLGRAAEHEAPFVLTVEETSDGLRVTDARTGAVTSVAPAGITLPNGELVPAARITRLHVGLEDVTDLVDAFRTLAHRMAFSAPVDAQSALGDGAAPSVMADVGSRDERVTLFRKIPNPREALYLRERVKKALALASAPAGRDGE